MKKVISGFLVVLLVFSIVGCDKKEVKSDAQKFKEEYESYNTQISGSGKEYRSVSIAEDNPMVFKEAGDIVTAIENKETFFVYFGYSTCPWCRSMIEVLIKAAKDREIDTIYYVDVHDIRDVLAINENGEIVVLDSGSEDYLKLLDLLSDVLEDYTLTDDEGNTVNTGEKRIYAPNVVYVEKGEAISLTSGTSELQTDAYMELTDEILDDSYEMIIELFNKSLDDNVQLTK